MTDFLVLFLPVLRITAHIALTVSQAFSFILIFGILHFPPRENGRALSPLPALLAEAQEKVTVIMGVSTYSPRK